MTVSTTRMILASGSPRRKELLSALGYEFEIIAPDVDESPLSGEKPADHVQRLDDRDAAIAPRLLFSSDSGAREQGAGQQGNQERESPHHVLLMLVDVVAFRWSSFLKTLRLRRRESRARRPRALGRPPMERAEPHHRPRRSEAPAARSLRMQPRDGLAHRVRTGAALGPSRQGPRAPAASRFGEKGGITPVDQRSAV